MPRQLGEWCTATPSAAKARAWLSSGTTAASCASSSPSCTGRVEAEAMGPANWEAAQLSVVVAHAQGGYGAVS